MKLGPEIQNIFLLEKSLIQFSNMTKYETRALLQVIEDDGG